MKPVLKTLVRLATTLALLLPATGGASDLPEKLTLNWMLSAEPGKIGGNPSYGFAANDLLRYDTTKPKEERTIELLDPESGKVILAVDRAKALDSLAELLGQEKASGLTGDKAKELGNPRNLSRDGRHAIYSRKGDLFVLDFASSTFSRLTDGSGQERGAQFSSDGSKVAFLRDNDLYVVDVESKKEKRLTHDGSETTLNGTLSWVYWEELFGRRDRGFVLSPSSNKIAYLQFDDTGVDIMTFIDPDPNTTRVIEQRYPKAGTANPKVRAGIVDLESGETTWVNLGSFPHEYLVRLVWLPDGQQLVTQTMDRAQQNIDLFLTDAETGEVSHLFRETDEAWVDVSDDLVFIEDGKKFLWVSSRAGHAHIYLYEIADGTAQLVRQLTQGDWSVTGGARRGDGMGGAIAAVDEKNGRVYFMARKESYLESHLYSVGLDGQNLQLETPLSGSQSHHMEPKREPLHPLALEPRSPFGH